MRKLFTVLALAATASVPVLAQDGPVRTDQDSKVIYFQDFEKSYESWSTDPSDSIVGMSYYDTKESPKPETVGNLSVYPVVRDTVLYLYDKIDTGGSEDAFPEDDFNLINDDGDLSRQDAFDMFGAKGGQQYLKYSAGLSSGATNGVQPNYRRNLDVRGVPIEEETSYRISMLLKVESKGSYTPTFRADIRRGTTRCNSPLSMGYDDDPENYLYDNDFEFETTSFNEGWDRVSFMAYYTNDFIAQRFMYNGSYNGDWGEFWSWKPDPVNAPNDSLMYVVQPNHYYLRLAFSTDSTVYSLDNLSLTKSWIGGVEHYMDMLRVDFGYETDMNELTAQAKERTNIDVVEVPGEYFTVWGYSKQWDQWEEVPINSAEYHGDGYMYMWTKPDEYGGQEFARLFDEYDSVLVSFQNPVDRPELCLHYNGELFPKANDIEWIKAGKIVPDFVNEISIANPNIATGVYSLKNLPPVIQGMPNEDGSFGLDGSVRELTFKFSKALAFDNKGESSEQAFLRVTKSGVKEIWTVKESTADHTTFIRPESAKGILDGEYQFEILNIKGTSTEYADNITFTWEFGDFDLNPSDEVVLQTNWSKEVTGTNRPIPTSLVVWNDKDKFLFGDGKDNSDHGNFLYLTEPNANGYDCGMFISARNKSKYTNGNVYMGLVDPIHVKPGKYSMSFISGTRIGTARTVVSCFKYSITGKDESTIETEIKAMAGSDKTIKDKILIGEFTPTQIHPESQWDSKKWPENVDSYSFLFEITEEADYVFDFTIDNVRANNGPVISDVTIKPVASISAPYVSAFNKALATAKERQAVAKADVKYQGACLDELGKTITKFEGWKNTAPSAYNNTTAAINEGIANMNLRIATVDKFLEHYGNVNDKLAAFEGTANKNLATVIALQKLYDDNRNYDFTAASATNDLLNEIIQSFDDGIDAIDTRLELMDKWNDKLAEIKAVLEDSLARKGYAEYGDLETYYNANKDNDIVSPDNEIMQQMYDAAYNAKNAYLFRCDLVDARTRQIKELFALCKALGDTFDGQESDLQQQIDALMDGDDQLEAMLRAEAIWQVNKAFAEKNPAVNGLDVSALVPNYYLYTTEKAFDHMKKNSSNMWVLKENTDDFYPHWTVTYKSGNSHPGATALDWEKDAHTYIAGHFMENSACSYISTTVDGLPVAYYNVRFDVVKIAGGNSYTCISTDADSYELKNTKNATGLMGQDSVLVSAGSKLTASFENRSASSSGTYNINGLSLVLTAPDASYNYTQAATDAKSAYDQIRTFVDDVKSVDNVSYYGLNGVQMNAPKAGQIAIRKTTLENGSTTLEKVLVK